MAISQQQWDEASNALNQYVSQLGGNATINWEKARQTFEDLAEQGGNFGDWVNRTFDARSSWLNGADGGTSGTTTTGGPIEPNYQGGGIDPDKFRDPTHNTEKYILLRALSATGLTPAQTRAQFAAGTGAAVDAMKALGYEIVSNNQVYKNGVGRLDLIHGNNNEFGYRRVSQDRDGKVPWPDAKTGGGGVSPPGVTGGDGGTTIDDGGSMAKFLGGAGGSGSGGTGGVDPYTTPTRPSSIADAYVAPQFTAPTYAELMQAPGYQASENAMQRGLERGAAAKGNLLSGGFIGRTVPRAMGEFAQQAYGNLFNERYNAFTGNAAAGLAGRQVNENAYQSDVGNSLNQYNARYRTYRDAIDDQWRLAQLGRPDTTRPTV